MTDIFLSYSRDDDQLFVKCLYEHLSKAGFLVWWDRVSMPGRALSFLQEIRDAVTNSERFILIVGPNAIQSDYVQAELQYALSICKTILPILRLGDFSLLPAEIKFLDTLDFRDDTQSASSFEVLKRRLKEPLAQVGKLIAVPDLPPHFISRPNDLKALKNAVLADVQTPIVISGTARRIGIQGMGGIGKTVLATALARDCNVRHTFFDGVLWMTIGQQPTLTLRQSQLAEALGDNPRVFIDEQQGKARLSELLKDKSCLLILDDIWHIEHVEAFDTLGPRCRMLITTRDLGVTSRLGAVEYCVEVLSSKQALKLLANWSGLSIDSLPNEANDIIQECGNLPLALAMVGAMVRNMPNRWNNALNKLRNADLQKIQQQFPNYPYPDLLRAIQVSVESLEPKIQERYLDLAVFPEDTPIPEAVLQTFWEPEGLDYYDVQDLIDILVGRSLILRDKENRLNLHDLQSDYIRKQNVNLPAQHDRLLGAYALRCLDGWATGPNDGYFFQYLSYHLIEAGHPETLRDLVLNSRWMHAQRIHDPSLQTYLEDVKRMLKIAEEQGTYGLPTAIALSLLYSTPVSRATNVPITALEVMVMLEEDDSALRYANLISDYRVQAEAYQRIGIQLYSKGRKTQAQQALKYARNSANNIQHEGRRAKTLSSLIKTMNQVGEIKLTQQVLEQALTIAEFIEEEWFRIEVLRDIAHNLVQSGKIEKAQNILSQIQATDKYMIEVLSDKVNNLIQLDEMENARNISIQIQKIAEQLWRDTQNIRPMFYVLRNIVRLGDIEQLDQIMNNILLMIETIQNEDQHAMALINLSQFLIEINKIEHARQILNQVLPIAKNIDDEQDRSSTFRYLAEALVDVGAFENAKIVANNLNDERSYSSVLSKIINIMAKKREFDQALTLINDIREPWFHDEALTEIVKSLAEIGAISRAEAVAMSIKDKIKCAQALGDVAFAYMQKKDEKLARKILNHLIAIVEINDDIRYHVQALAKIASELATVGEVEEARQLITKASILAKEIQHGWYAIQAMGDIAVALVKVGKTEEAHNILDQALMVTQKIKNEYYAWMLSKVAKYLVKIERVDHARQVLNQAIEQAEISGDRMECARTLSSVAECFTALGESEKALDILTRALDAAERIGNKDRRAWALSEVALHLIDMGENEQARQALTKALPMATGNRSLSYVALVQANLGEINQALALLDKVSNKNEAATGMHGIVSVLIQKNEIDRALKMAISMIDDFRGERAEALCDVGQHLIQVGKRDQAHEVLARALVAAENIDSIGGWRPYALDKVAQSLAQLLQPSDEKIVNLLMMAFQTARSRGRTEIWIHIKAFAKILGKLGMIKSVLSQIQQVEKLWEQLE